MFPFLNPSFESSLLKNYIQRFFASCNQAKFFPGKATFSGTTSEFIKRRYPRLGLLAEGKLATKSLLVSPSTLLPLKILLGVKHFSF